MISVLIPLITALLILTISGVFISFVFGRGIRSLFSSTRLIFREFLFQQSAGTPFLFVSEDLRTTPFLCLTVTNSKGKKFLRMTDSSGLIFLNTKIHKHIEVLDKLHSKKGFSIDENKKGEVLKIKEITKAKKSNFLINVSNFTREYALEISWSILLLVSVQIFIGFLNSFIHFSDTRSVYFAASMLLYGLLLTYFGSLGMYRMFKTKGLLINENSKQPIRGALVVVHKGREKYATFTNSSGVFTTSIKPGEYDIFLTASGLGEENIQGVGVNNQGFLNRILKIGNKKDEKGEERDDKNN